MEGQRHVRLVLGTAQFGLPYGITRETEEVPDAELQKLLTTAAALGVAMVDTSPAYGIAEERLGQLFSARTYQVQTKTRGGLSELPASMAQQDFESSLLRLKRSSVDSFLIHSVDQLFSTYGVEIFEFLQALRFDGHVNRIGVSVYDVEQINRVLELFTPDVVQVPVSVADQRLVENGGLARLKDAGVCIQARSVFLQGVLLTTPDSFMRVPDFLTSHLARFHAETPDAPARCIGFLASLGIVDEVVFGVHTLTQLRTIARAFERPEYDVPWRRFKFPNDAVDPRQWSGSI